ncbi:MAG TPA: LacI family DNA-binding transcriptional regulator, partial [Flavobacterium sp.]
MSKKTTIYDIAKKLDTTAATVSRALNNNPKISASTRKLVLETAALMNYKQNKLALALQSGKSGNIGVIVPRIDSNFFASVIRGIEDELQPEGYHVIICQTHEDEKREIENINTLLNAQVDGILMSVSNVSKENDTVIKRVVEKNVPLIFFDRKKNIDGVSSVTINDFEGGYLATKHLIEEGCTKIAHLTGDQSLEIYENRNKGYKQALLDSGITFDEN